MRRRTLALVTSVLAALAAGSVGGAALDAGTVPAGCWLGKGSYSGTYASGPVTARVTSGTISLRLWVGKNGDAVGLLDTGAVGKGNVKISGSTLALTVLMKGRFDVTGSTTKLVVNGKDRWKGKAVGKGQFLTVPVDLTLPVKNASLAIVAATPSRVTFRYGKAAFVANRVKKLPKPVGDLCT